LIYNLSTKILVSFCSVFPRGLALGIYDYENEDFNYVNLNEIDEKYVRGITGIAFKNNKYLILSQCEEKGISGFFVLNTDFNVEQTFIMQKTKDAHSLIPFEDGFLVTDPGHNRINKITVTNNLEKLEEKEFWRYNDDLEDTVHINSIAHANGKIFVSLFDKKPENGAWRDAKSGKIVEIENNKIVFQNLYHPHTLVFIDDELYCLESGKGLVHKFFNHQHKVILELNGYIRGMTFDENYLYVGASAHRKTSRSIGIPNAPISSKTEDTHSWIYRINRKTLDYEKKDMTYFGAEIFDLRIISHNYILSNTEDPIIQRMLKLEDYPQIIKKKDEELEAKNKELSDLRKILMNSKKLNNE